MNTSREAQARKLLAALLVLAASACGGGGGDESSAPPPMDHPPNSGAGRIQIESPAGDSLTVDRDTVFLSGSAFISRTYYRCCSGTAEDTGVWVSWSDSAGTGGRATQSVRYCSLGFGLPWVCEHTWRVSVPLTMGEHIIVVSAHDPGGNVGYDSVRVRRVPDTTPPTVMSNFPAAEATKVDLNSTIGVAFSEAIDPASVNQDTIVVVDRDGNRVPGTVTTDGILGARSPKFVVTGSLAANMLYNVTAGAGVRDESGNALQAPRVWSFTTGAVFDITAPSVATTTPADGSFCAFIDTKPTVTFDEAIDAATVTDQSFQLSDGVSLVSGDVVALSPETFRFGPHAGLRYASTYTATLTRGIRDLAGNAVAVNRSWTFSTVAAGTGRWRPTSVINGGARQFHSAVWTGTEMIVWGGGGWFASAGGQVGTGFRYEPAADTWVPTSNAGAPADRYGHVAVWTGSEMIVWGGSSIEVDPVQGDVPFTRTVEHLDGARYNPATDSWSTMSGVNAPTENVSAAAWTGTEMIVWTGAGGARYNPATNSWQALPAPIEPMLGAKAIWTGSKLIVWGSSGSVAGSTGAIYDPAMNSWQAISSANAPSRLGGQSSVWTGNELIVWGGYAGGEVDSGGVYDPQTNTWRPMSNCGASPRAEHTAVWTGTEMIVWGGTSANTGQAYDPITDTWRQLDVVNAPAASGGHTAVWSGSEMIVWTGASGAVYAP